MSDWSKVISPEATAHLEANWVEQQPRKGRNEIDYRPACKVFLPWTSGTWLLTEKEPDSSLCFGLCDLGMGSPELGYVDLEELYSVPGPAGLRVEQDIHFTARKTLSEYADEAINNGCIRA